MGHGRYIAPPKGQYQVQSGEKLELQYVILPGESRDLEITVDLAGPGAQAQVKVLYLCRADEKVRIRVVMHHLAPECHSTQLINGIAGGQADVRFDGTIVVAPDAQKTEAYQENHNIVLTQEAKVVTKPQLEIYTDDLMCSHGSAVGQLDEEALFYMRTRGIGLEEARRLLMQAFVADVIDGVRLDALKDRLHYLVEKRFAGTLSSCAGCMAACRSTD